MFLLPTSIMIPNYLPSKLIKFIVKIIYKSCLQAILDYTGKNLNFEKP